MSIYANNEYIISTNNNMNENKYNTDKLKRRGLRALLRPILRAVKKSISKPKKIHSIEEEQNFSNERLERDIIREVESCGPDAAVFVYEQDSCNIVPVSPHEYYVPVHFARTAAGTFFWTSAAKAELDFAAAGHCYTECQHAEQQIPVYADRWAQA